ncbi:hypothetical protein AL714_14880 [Clostridium botulinum]|uniref:Uncharacterized protein n=2 Tax=Clostridium botulinum TaxID=1491 RepID=A0A077K2W9_CLOBO|nr:hypothetical protein N493_18895 [Clostridium botulinum B2 433]KIS21638.1 hypothetical protein N495_19760 [Clostridium botulinum B2 450]OPD36132.1 hypothetical protein AL714_14880 [Clostridium botulinum]BAP25837.1 hypothetical protein [Clostridium botulinum]
MFNKGSLEFVTYFSIATIMLICTIRVLCRTPKGVQKYYKFRNIVMLSYILIIGIWILLKVTKIL